jgi:mannose-6-phosphate isomerase-like protein (cupin superfamily)
VKSKARLVKSNLLPVISEPNNDLVLRQLVSRAVDGPEISITWVDIAGQHNPLKTDSSTRIYYILEGDFVFDCEKMESMSASAGDVVVIYKSCLYSFKGSGKYLVINSPAFQEGDDIYIQENHGGGTV